MLVVVLVMAQVQVVQLLTAVEQQQSVLQTLEEEEEGCEVMLVTLSQVVLE